MERMAFALAVGIAIVATPAIQAQEDYLPTWDERKTSLREIFRKAHAGELEAPAEDGGSDAQPGTRGSVRSAAGSGARPEDAGEPDREGSWQSAKSAIRDTFHRARTGTLEPATVDGIEHRPAEEPAFDADGLRRTIVDLFTAYEREDLPAFVALVHPTFHARDDSGNDYRFADLPRALSDDFASLDHIRYSVHAGAPVVQVGGGRAQLEVRWSRRAWSEIDALEWIVLDQRTVFVLERSPNPGWRIVQILGHAIFALARRDGRVVADRGTLDGDPIEDEIFLDRNGVEKPHADSPSPPPVSVQILQIGVQNTELDLDDAANPVRPCGGGAPNDIEFRCFMPNLFGTSATAGMANITGQVGDLGSVTLAYLQGLPYADSSFGGLTGGPSDVGLTFAVRTDQGNFAILRVVGAAAPFYSLELAFYR